MAALLPEIVQRVSTSEILNRMIVPLEKRFDLVSMPSGRQIQIPFDSMLAFATNLEPRQLFDEAFLRRLPYKVCFNDPTPAEFRQLFESLARQLNIKFDEVVAIARQMRSKSMAKEFKGTVKEVLGTCNAVGCRVDGKKPTAVQAEIDSGERKVPEK